MLACHHILKSSGHRYKYILSLELKFPQKFLVKIFDIDTVGILWDYNKNT